MRIKIFTLLIVSLLSINSASSQLLGWTFDEVIRLKGKDYKTGPSKEGSYFVSYEAKTSIVNGKEYPVGSGETYLLKTITNKVWRYVLVGLKSEGDIIEIIEKNNSRFKKVDMGSKQTFYQWIDVQNNTEYTLSIQMQLEDNKFILYSCTIKE
jgi:hypothetical protein